MVLNLTTTVDLRDWMLELPPDEVIFGTTERLQDVRAGLEKLAATDLPVLIEGAGGSGRSTLARWVHAHSAKKHERFVEIHSATIPTMLFDGAWAGHDTGCFASGRRFKHSRSEVAGGGTLFLDEISELELDLQATLLHLLHDGRFTRIGGQEEEEVGARFICSTRQSLSELAASGDFYKELLFRINVVHIHLPSLKDRVADIPVLAGWMIEECGRKYGVAVRPLSAELLNLMQACAWPGNIRQLENLVRRYVVLGCDEEIISADLLDDADLNLVRKSHAKAPLKSLVHEVVKERERKIILRTLYTHHWNRKAAAHALGISYQTLSHKMRHEQLVPRRSQATGSELPSQPAALN